MRDIIECAWVWLPPVGSRIPIHQRVLFSVQPGPGMLCPVRGECDCIITSRGLLVNDLIGESDGPYAFEAERYVKRPPGSDSRYFSQ
jgi:hypothetical protein